MASVAADLRHHRKLAGRNDKAIKRHEQASLAASAMCRRKLSRRLGLLRLHELLDDAVAFQARQIVD
ncbi:MAG: hypothetical protein MI824_15410, partial [Hyphomicrobiales bacterium]|nr:hypothetical protein [Hyphomicrobiales bacterium]